MKTAELLIGTSGKAACGLPVDVVTDVVAVLGRRGSGKSNTATRLVEEALCLGVQVVVLDPKAEWWGLALHADGKPNAHNIVVLGGARGDLPLAERDGAALADFAVENPGQSLVLSLRHFETDAAQRRFVTDFAKRLYFRKGEPAHQTPLLLVLEEAHLFVPQRVDGAVAPMVGALQKLVRQGRAFGVGVLLIDQRPASVNKEVLTQAGLLIVHQVTGPHDRKALQEWIDSHDARNHAKEFHDTLAGLQVGEAWVWSGERDLFVRAKIDHRRTFDSSVTPKPGATRGAVPAQRAKADLEALRAKLAQTVEEAAQNDPAHLKREIARLQGELRKQKPGVDEQAPVRAVERALRERDAQWSAAVRSLVEEIQAAVKAVRITQPTVLKSSPPPPVPRGPGLETRANSGHRLQTGVTAGRTAARVRCASNNGNPGEAAALGKAERSILSVLLTHGPCSKAKTALLAGYAVGGGGFNNALSRLRGSGLIDGSDPLSATDQAAATVTPDVLPVGDELFAWWCARVGKCEREILEALRALGGGPVTKEGLAANTATGYEPAGGGFGNALSKLRTLGLISGRGEIVLAEELR